MKSWREVRELNILGIIWKVKKKRTLKEISPGKNSWGCTVPTKREIWLWAKIPTERDYRLALFHEITHNCINHMRGIPGDGDIVEWICDSLTKFQFQVLQDNGLI